MQFGNWYGSFICISAIYDYTQSVFRTLSNINDGAIDRVLVTLGMLDRVLNTPLILTRQDFHFQSALTHFSPVSHFYTPWKRQKTKSFQTFSGGIETWHWTKMGSSRFYSINEISHSKCINSFFFPQYF